MYAVCDTAVLLTQSAYMNFKKATDELLSSVSHQELATALGCSVATVRQARLTEDALARRSAPAGWERVVIQLAERKAEDFIRLAEKLKSEPIRIRK
jgi:hypothetical protein